MILGPISTGVEYAIKEQQAALEQAADAALKNDVDALKQRIENATIEQLDILAKRILEKDRDAIGKLDARVAHVIKERVDKLHKQLTVERRLESLTQRVHLLKLLPQLAPAPTPSEQHLKSDLRQLTQGVADGVSDYVLKPFQDLVLKPMAGFTKNWLIIGPVTSFFANLSREEIKQGAMRLWYTVLAAPSFLGISESTPLIGRLLSTVCDDARRNLMILDIHSVIREARSQGEQAEEIVFQGCSNAAWVKAKERMKDGTRIRELVEKYIADQRQNRVGKIAFSVDDLIKAPEEQKKDAEKMKREKMKQRVIESWKGPKITSVEFGTDVVAEKDAEGYKLTLSESEVQEDGGGTLKFQARAGTLRRAMETMKDVPVIRIAASGDPLELEWRAGKVAAKLPLDTTFDLRTLSNICARGFINRVSILRLASDARLKTDKPRIRLEVGADGRGILLGNGMADTLTYISNTWSSSLKDSLIPNADPGAEWRWESGSWQPEPKAMPIQPPSPPPARP